MRYSNDPMFKLRTPEESIALHLQQDTPLTNLPTIPEFYAGQEIFITGGSGFMGKVLIEKLLRSCPDLKTIFVLMRPKKEKSIEKRLKEICDLQLFDLLRIINPNFSKKLIAISGNAAELKIGLSKEDSERMKNVSIIFHSAASVRFDDSLKYAILMNTRGTREVMKFAETLKDIKLVMHVSTAFSNVFIHTVEEKIYPAAADWRKTIEICEKMDEDQLDCFTEHYISFMPNTYVFSKNLAEHVTNSYKAKLPVVLFRPSVVIGSQKEPFEGWVDNFNGPMGILLASVLGISKTMYCDPKNILDMVGVDICAKAMIIASWKRAHEPKEAIPVYNCSSGNLFKTTIEQMLDIGIYGVCREISMEHMVWQAGGGVTLSKSLNFVRLMIYQVIPAIFLDLGLKLKNQKPRLLGLQRKMYEANKALSYFVTNNWDFKNKNLISLNSFLRLEDLKAFAYRNDHYYDKVLSARYCILGYRRYLLKESDESIPRCHQTYLRIEIANNIIKSIPYLIAFYYGFVKYDLIGDARAFIKSL